MKKFMCACAVISVAGIGWTEVIVGWEAFGASTTQNTTQSGSDAWGQLILDEYGSQFNYTARGSGDGTFGTVSGASDGTAWLDRSLGLTSTTVNKMTVVVENTHTSDNLVLTGLHLDTWRSFNNAPWKVEVTAREGNISGGAVQTVFLNSKGSDPGFNSASDFDDFDIALSGLSDSVLAPGEKAWIDITISQGSTTGVTTYFDNIALTGNYVVPEPATMGLVAAAGGFLLLIRRFRM